MKIIATDYDGTLNCNGITQKKLETIEKWRNAGNKFGIISGRMLPSLIDIVTDKNIKYDFLVACNGAVICDENNNIYHMTKCPGEMISPLLEAIFEAGCDYGVVGAPTEEVRVCASQTLCQENEFTINTMPPTEWFNQISTMLDTDEEAARVTKIIAEKFRGVLTPLLNGNCIDIVPVPVNKAFGIYRILEIFNADYSDAIAVGDNINDTDMIKEFRSFAMRKGVDKIKQYADGIIDDITELIEAEL